MKCVSDGFDVWLSFANYAFLFFPTLPDNQHQKYLTFVKSKEKKKSLTPTKYEQAIKGVSRKSLNRPTNPNELPQLLNFAIDKTTFFFLSLFVEHSRAFGCPMSIQTNHRNVDIKNLQKKKDINGKEGSLEDYMLSKDGTSVTDFVCYVFPYEVKYEDERKFLYEEQVQPAASMPNETGAPSTPPPRMKIEDNAVETPSRRIQQWNDTSYNPIVSLVRGNFKYAIQVDGESVTIISNGVAVFDKVSIKPVSRTTYTSTVKLFGEAPGMFDHRFDESKSKSSFFDWTKLFNLDNIPDGSSLESLQAFVKKYDLPVEMPPEDDETDHDLAQVRRQIRNAVQRLVPLRFAFLEGNHRVELAIRKLYGVPLNVTMEVGQVEPVFESSLEPTCALFQPLPVRLLQYPSKHVLLSNGMLQDLVEMSKQIMVEKQTSIDTSWRQCMNHAYDHLDRADFFCNHMPQFTAFYSYPRPETVKGEKCDVHPLVKRSKDIVKCLYEFMKSHDTTKTIIADVAKKGEAVEEGIKKCIKQYLCPPGVVTLKQTPDNKRMLRGSGVPKLGYSINGMLWLFSVLSAHQDSWDFLKTYLSSTRENIHDPDFILAYVTGPVNHIANFLSIKMIQMILSAKKVFPKKVDKKERNCSGLIF